jgi:hypothetical protein
LIIPAFGSLAWDGDGYDYKQGRVVTSNKMSQVAPVRETSVYSHEGHDYPHTADEAFQHLGHSYRFTVVDPSDFLQTEIEAVPANFLDYFSK